MQTHNVLWQVSLSNGETHQEGSISFPEIEGELSPWQKLLQYLKTGGKQGESPLAITSLSLFTVDGRTFNVPSSGNNPRFQAFRVMEKPQGYKMFRAVASERNMTKNGEIINDREVDKYTVAAAVYDMYELQIWVDEHDTKNCWVVIEGKV